MKPLFHVAQPSGWSRACAAVLSSLAPLVLSGCAVLPPSFDVVTGPDYAPANVYGRHWSEFHPLRKVAVLPLAGPQDAPGKIQIEPVFQAEITRAAVFETVQISPADLEQCTGQSTWSANGPLPKALLERLRKQYGCDGILLPQLTEYSPYPPIALGFKVQLAATDTGQTLWASDEVFNSGVPAVANGARRYQKQQTQGRYPAPDSRLILLCPTAFAHYCSATLVANLSPETPQ
jgi:hypothetical protein